MTTATEAPSADAQWIREAVQHYEEPLMRYAARLLHDADRARDVVQDTFLRLWQADRTTVDGHLAQWLFRVCRNRSLDVLRKERRMTALETDCPGGVASEGAAPSRHAEQNETGRALLELLAGLPDRQQEILRLKFQAGLSYREIAGVMDLTVSHVGVLIHNAIKTIRERAAGAGVAGRVAPSSAGSAG